MLFVLLCMREVELLLLGDNILEGGGGGEQGIFRPQVLGFYEILVPSS